MVIPNEFQNKVDTFGKNVVLLFQQFHNLKRSHGKHLFKIYFVFHDPEK